MRMPVWSVVRLNTKPAEYQDCVEVARILLLQSSPGPETYRITEYTRTPCTHWGTLIEKRLSNRSDVDLIPANWTVL